MAAATDFPTRGKVLASKDGMIAFNPRGTTYELHLRHAGEAPPLNTLIDVLVRGTARKVWTVPSGGNFVTPIVGTPRVASATGKIVEALAVEMEIAELEELSEEVGDEAADDQVYDEVEDDEVEDDEVEDEEVEDER